MMIDDDARAHIRTRALGRYYGRRVGTMLLALCLLHAASARKVSLSTQHPAIKSPHQQPLTLAMLHTHLLAPPALAVPACLPCSHAQFCMWLAARATSRQHACMKGVRACVMCVCDRCVCACVTGGPACMAGVCACMTECVCVCDRMCVRV